jgi:hypothetical protein
MTSAPKPNLFVIGAMKSGTSSLCQYLSEHPAVFMSPVKEPMHFSREENWSGPDERYLRLFRRASNQRYLAEGSTEYTQRPSREGVAARIHQFNPSARLVYVMRDPFERLVSHYRHAVRKGWEKEPLARALQADSIYLTTSHYAYQLKPYVELFGRDAVYGDTAESLAGSPLDFCGRLFAWLGIDGFTPPSAGRRLNVSPEVIERFDEGSLRVRFSRSLSRYARLAPFVPESVRRWYKALLPKESVQPTESPEFRQELEQARRAHGTRLAEWVRELEEVTGRSYDEWPSRKG